MEASKKRRLFRIVTAVWALAAFGLRIWTVTACKVGFQSGNSGDVSDVRILAPRFVLILTLVFSLAGLVLLLVFGSCFRKTPCTDRVFSRPGIWVFLPLAGACLLLAGSLPAVLELLKGAAVAKFRLLTALFGLVSAILTVPVLLRRSVLGKNAFWFQFPLVVFSGMNMIYHFRNWSHDPIIADIAPLALAAICFLLSTMLIAGFSLNVGRRRSTAVWGSMAVIFTAMCLPDFLLGVKSGVSVLLTWLGLALWCGYHAAMLVAAADSAEADAPALEPDAPEAPEPPAEAGTPSEPSET